MLLACRYVISTHTVYLYFFGNILSIDNTDEFIKKLFRSLTKLEGPAGEYCGVLLLPYRPTVQQSQVSPPKEQKQL